MKSLNPTEYAAKWASKVASSGGDYKKGVSAVTTSPGAAAAAQKDLYVANVTASADKWASRVGAVSLADWKKQTLDFGVSAYTSSGSKGQSKVQSFATAVIPFLNSATSSLPPRGNKAQNQARYAAMQAAWDSFSYSKRSL